MRSAYRRLAGAIALLVALQAASIAYATFAISHAIDNGATFNSDSKVGDGGFAIHYLDGLFLIPLLAITLLVISFLVRSRVPHSVKWAGFVALAVVIQVALGFNAHRVPELGWLHGANALVLVAVAVTAARLPATAPEG